MKISLKCWGWLIVGVISLVACSTTPTLYHTLNNSTPNPATATHLSKHIASLGIGPLTLPTVLDRESIVVRKTPTRVEVSDSHLWGGQLEDEFLNALTQQLRARLPLTRVQTIPWELTQTPLYQISLKVQEFAGSPQGIANLNGTGQLQLAANGKILMTEPFQLQRKVMGKTIDDVVQAQSLLISDLADQLISQWQAKAFISY